MRRLWSFVLVSSLAAPAFAQRPPVAVVPPPRPPAPRVAPIPAAHPPAASPRPPVAPVHVAHASPVAAVPLRGFVEHPENLFTGRSLAPADREAHNQSIVEQLRTATPLASPGRKAGLSGDEAASLFKAVAESPIVRQSGQLAPKVRGICFGKAVGVHLEAIRMGVDKELIGKAWAVFDGNADWSHHVATIVPKAGGGYWAIDPLERGPIDATEWVSKWSSPTTTAYVTPAARYGPQLGRKYSNLDLSWEGVAAYFDAMRAWMKGRATPQSRSPSVASAPILHAEAASRLAEPATATATATATPGTPTTPATAPPPNDFQELMHQIHDLTSTGRRSMLLPELRDAMLMAATHIDRRNRGSHDYDGLLTMADFLDSATEQLQTFQRNFVDNYRNDRPRDATLLGLVRTAAQLRAYVASQRGERL